MTFIKTNHTLDNTLSGKGICNGSLFIADISGFTKWVHHTDLEAGRKITYELLQSIIDSNVLNWQISEIEGDAVFFYQCGQPPSVSEVIKQYEAMLTAFNKKQLQIEDSTGRSIDLSLKLISHYGSFAEYRIDRFTKLYGEAIIETHRLLKNNINSTSYIMFTDAFITNAGLSANEKRSIEKENKMCEAYSNLTQICYTYINYEASPASKKLCLN